MSKIQQNDNVINAFRFSNYSLPLINELPVQTYFGWYRGDHLFFFTGWKTLVRMKADGVKDFSFYVLNKRLVNPMMFADQYLSMSYHDFLNPLKLSRFFRKHSFFVKVNSSFREEKKMIAPLAYSMSSASMKSMGSLDKQEFFLESIVKRKKRNTNISLGLNPTSLEYLRWRSAIWNSLHKRWKQKKIVYGRFLNVVKGGYSIGIGGFVAFLPKSCWFFKRYSLGRAVPFRILNMRPLIKNIVVSGLKPRKFSKFSKFFKFSRKIKNIKKGIKICHN